VGAWRLSVFFSSPRHFAPSRLKRRADRGNLSRISARRLQHAGTSSPPPPKRSNRVCRNFTPKNRQALLAATIRTARSIFDPQCPTGNSSLCGSERIIDASMIHWKTIHFKGNRSGCTSGLCPAILIRRHGQSDSALAVEDIPHARITASVVRTPTHFIPAWAAARRRSRAVTEVFGIAPTRWTRGLVSLMTAALFGSDIRD